ELYAKALGIKARLLEVGDVAGELVVAHLLRGAVFLHKIGRLLVDLREGTQGEGPVGCCGLTLEGALPAVFEDPLIDGVVPACGRGEDAPLECEGCGVELEDGEVGKDVLVGVEELVVEDARWSAVLTGLAGDPFA